MYLLKDFAHTSSSSLADVGRKIGRSARIMVVSNRGPVAYRESPEGQLIRERGCGGLATALSSLSRHLRFTWIAAALSDADRRVALACSDAIGDAASGHDPALRFVTPDETAYDLYYNVVSNPLLWFAQHGMLELLGSTHSAVDLQFAWYAGYARVNRAFAEVVADEAARHKRPPVVMLQDYHLYLAPAYLRRRLPGAVLQHFIHIPWPAPGCWEPLPFALRWQICRSLLANDIVGFQTERSARNFLRTCQLTLGSRDVDYRHGEIRTGRHTTLVRSYPISVDGAGLRETAKSPEVEGYRRHLQPLLGEQTIVRVDRLDPSKNIVRGFEAFDLLLRRRPDLVGRVRFLAFLVPSRTSIPEYRRYTADTLSVVDRINAQYSRDDWQPITVFYEDNYLQGLAAMSLYDVLLVNPLADGMNLVAKEGPVVNERDGVLVLSTEAGAYEQLGDGVLAVDPRDVPGTATALGRALALPVRHRRLLQSRLRAAIEEADLQQWLRSQLADIETVARRKATAPAQSARPAWPARRSPALVAATT